MLCPTDLRPTPYVHFKGFQSCDVLLSPSPCFCTVQGRTSNQCFTILFLRHLHTPLGNSLLLEKASFSLLSRASILGAEGRDPHILGKGVVWGSQGGSQGGRWGRERVVKYYYILSCKGSMFESGYF